MSEKGLLDDEAHRAVESLVSFAPGFREPKANPKFEDLLPHPPELSDRLRVELDYMVMAGRVGTAVPVLPYTYV